MRSRRGKIYVFQLGIIQAAGLFGKIKKGRKMNDRSGTTVVSEIGLKCYINFRFSANSD